MLADRLEKAWRDRLGSRTVDPLMRFAREGLVLGAGTVLVAAGATSRDVTVDPLAPRLRALLAAAHLSRPQVQALAHLGKAADAWRRGEKPLAAMHLALSGLDRLRQPQADAHRLFLADALIAEGVTPGAIVAAVESGDLRKFDPDQPRVPSGSGRTSGQWTIDGDADAGGSAATGDSDRSTSSSNDASNVDGPHPIPNATVGEVNPASLNLQPAHTPTVGVYVGPDACDVAKNDCYQNAYLRTATPGAANDTASERYVFDCYFAGAACKLIGLAVDEVHLLRRGAVLYPDGGIVIADKGNPKRFVYYPDGAHRKGWPFVRS